ncbi:hypothetical protein VE03_05598 [Pseudogymnoascus sp. 23342-1-I1]|nr:hypothetical protein VE03_05598 [Pseudogymnoascus sp. 23342-1-I1]
MAMNFVTFNQDYSRLAIGTSKGFRIYHSDPEFRPAFKSDEDNVSIIEMMFSTSLVALVLSPRRLVIRNTKRSSTICELTFPSAVLAVRLNRKRLVVVLEEEIYLYDILNMNLLYTISTSPNPHALCALSPSSDNCFLAYPLPKARDEPGEKRPAHAPPTSKFVPPISGEVLLFDTLTLKNINVVEAHRAPLSCIALNNDGTRLATASETGTIIRVFSVPSGDKLYQFRRGSYPSTIYSMSFNLSSTLLCVSSTTDTVHIFRLSPPGSPSSRPTSPPSPTAMSRGRSHDSATSSGTSPGSEIGASLPTRKSSGTLGSMFRRTSQLMGKNVVGAMGGYLPKGVTEMWEPARDFAFIKIPKSGGGGALGGEGGSGNGQMRSVVAMSSNFPQVMVVTSDGGFYVFNIDMEEGGEGVLVKQYSVLQTEDKFEQGVLDG